MTPALLAGLTGVLQGARHALEPDHVTAVATVMVEAPSPRRGIFYAGCWGVGHASMLLFVAGPLVALRVELPNLLSTILELGVGAMLIYLGVRTLRELRERTGLRHAHARNANANASASASANANAASLIVRGRRPFAIGIMHGLAGSGALAALIALGSPTVATGLACLAFYAVGTIVGMVALAALAGPMLARAGRLPKVTTTITQVAGVASIVVGVAWAVRTLAAVVV